MKKQVILVFLSIGIFIFAFLMNTGAIFAKSSQYERFECPRSTGEGFYDSNLPLQAQRAWQSTVQIRFIRINEIEETKRKVKVGSGIILDLDPKRRVALIVTANHCLARQTNRLYRYEVKFPGKPKRESKMEKYYTSRKVSIVKVQSHKDLVYLRVKYPHKAHPIAALLRAIDNNRTPFKNLISIGFPILNLRSRKSWNIFRPENYQKIIKRFSKGKLLAKGPSGNQVYIIAHNADMLYGNSGGPLIDPDGKVVGINTGVFYSDSKKTAEHSKYNYCSGNPKRFYFAVSISEVLKDLEFLKKNKLW